MFFFFKIFINYFVPKMFVFDGCNFIKQILNQTLNNSSNTRPKAVTPVFS